MCRPVVVSVTLNSVFSNLLVVRRDRGTPDGQSDLRPVLYQTCLFNVSTSSQFLPKHVAFDQISAVTYVVHIVHRAAYRPDRLREGNNSI